MWATYRTTSPRASASKGSEEDKGVELLYMSSLETKVSSLANGNLGEIHQILESNVYPAPAKVWTIDNIMLKGPTGCDPGQNTFFQTLQIQTKITRG